MPSKKAKAAAPTVGDCYIVVDSDRNVYYFDEDRLYKFLNAGPGEDREGNDLEGKERTPYLVLETFPLPLETEDNGEGRDAAGRYFGNYCPFVESDWTYDSVIVLKNDKIFVPKFYAMTRTVEFEGYGPDPAAPSAALPEAKPLPQKAAAKRRRRR